MRANGGANRRFDNADIDPTKSVSLNADHPALRTGNTIFPTTVVGSFESPRFLISGHNNPKLGRAVLKGARTGWPIFALALEERATCPRSCEQWASCYGNAMPFARRHRVDDDFELMLRSEVATVARQYPSGLLIRLHVLGDFYSARYVMLWAQLLMQFPQLHVFGYTARRVDDADPESAKTAKAIKVLTDAMWSRFAIRTSASDPVARSRSIVVDVDPGEADTIVCPAQKVATESCATCGLCWSDNARDKTIAFLRHGMSRERGPKTKRVAEIPNAASKPVQDIGRPAAPLTGPAPLGAAATDYSEAQISAMDRLLAGLCMLADGSASVAASFSDLHGVTRIPAGSLGYLTGELERRGLVSIERPGLRRPNVYTLLQSQPVSAPAVEVKTAAIAAKPVEIRRDLTVPAAPPVVARAVAPAPPARTQTVAFLEREQPLEEPAPSQGHCSLLNLRTDHCHFPVGVGEPQQYCNKPATVGQYCSKHHATMRQGKPK